MPSTTTTTTTPTSPPNSSLPHNSSTIYSLKRKTMSITQTYYLAHTARGKLSSEAARADHNLRLLVGHANLLDSLMIELAEVEQEQESWFNQSVKGATKEESSRHIQWADAVIEEPEEDWQAEDADSDSDDDDDSEGDQDHPMDNSIEMHAAGIMSLWREPSHTTVSEIEADDEEDYEEDSEDYTELSLIRSSSHSVHPPALVVHDSEDDSSEDESMPPSPPTTTSPSFSEKERQQIATTSFYDNPQSQTKLAASEQAAFFDDGYYFPQRRRSPSLISAISVY